MNRPRRISAIGLAGLMAVVAAPGVTLAAKADPGLSAAQLRSALSSMTPEERDLQSKYFTDNRWLVEGYIQMWVAADGSTTTTSETTSTGTRTTTWVKPGSLKTRKASTQLTSNVGSTLFNGLYISVSVSRDTDIKFEYRYDIMSTFDWQGISQPWNGVVGVDGMAIYWGNSLALLSSYFWGHYRDGTNLMNVSQADAAPNAGVGYEFWEAKNNFGNMIADFGYLSATVARSDYTNFITNFSVKYLHTWQNNQFDFAWGAGPSVSFSPVSGSQGISAFTSLRT